MAAQYHRKKRFNIEEIITGFVVGVAIITFLIQVALMITDATGLTK